MTPVTVSPGWLFAPKYALALLPASRSPSELQLGGLTLLRLIAVPLLGVAILLLWLLTEHNRFPFFVIR